MLDQNPQSAPSYTIQPGHSLSPIAVLSLPQNVNEFAYFPFIQPSTSVAIEIPFSRILCLVRCALQGLAKGTGLVLATTLGQSAPRKATDNRVRAISSGHSYDAVLTQLNRTRSALADIDLRSV